MTQPCRVLITAGPTHEPIDAVRYLANRSSGRMGIAIAEAAARAGLPTTLLLGPTHLQPAPRDLPNSSQTTLIRFQTTADLQRLLAEHWPRHEVLIMAAAVADYRPVVSQADLTQTKLRRVQREMALSLEPTPDLLGKLAATTGPNQTVIGFALEPAERLRQSAEEKLQRKQLDAIVANPLETMDADTVTATVYLRTGQQLAPPPNISKAEFAQWLIEMLDRIRGSSAFRE